MSIAVTSLLNGWRRPLKPQSLACKLWGDSADDRAIALIEPLLDDGRANLEVRREAARQFLRLPGGAERVVTRIEKNRLAESLITAVTFHCCGGMTMHCEIGPIRCLAVRPMLQNRFLIFVS